MTSGPTARSNSLHFVVGRSMPRSPGRPCPLAPSGDPSGPRVLWLRLRDAMVRCETRTADFSEEEIERVTGRGQLYLDVSGGKAAFDDFARDLRKLRLSRECLPCPARARCAGCWVGDDAAVFGRDDARVRTLLGSLRGRILDVGAGEAPYAEALAPAAGRGEVDYLGLDPSRERLELLSARHGAWARFRQGTLESLSRDEPGRRFDHALVLRSWNHLPDPEAAARALGRLVRGGGTLLVVDNVAFGVVRRERAAWRAEQGPGRFEHFRNDGAEEALAALQPAGFQPREVAEVSPATSNQWLLHLTRSEDPR